MDKLKPKVEFRVVPFAFDAEDGYTVEVQALLSVEHPETGKKNRYLGTAANPNIAFNCSEDFTKSPHYAELCDEAYEDLLGMLRSVVRDGEAAAAALALYREECP